MQLRSSRRQEGDPQIQKTATEPPPTSHPPRERKSDVLCVHLLVVCARRLLSSRDDGGELRGGWKQSNVWRAAP